MTLHTTTILIEKDPSNFQCLRETLVEVGVGCRVRQTTDFHSLADGEIALVNGDSMLLVDDLLAYTAANNHFAFYLLDPWGAIPFDFVRKVIRKPSTT